MIETAPGRLLEAAPAYSELPTGRWIEVGGLRTWYTEQGNGEPVVLVYGGNFGGAGAASGAYAWAPALHGISDSHRVFAYDKPGQGYTDAPLSLDDYTMRAVVEHLIGFITALDAGPVHLVGHSRGGYIATRTTLLRQDLVRSVTLVNSGTLSPGIGTNEVVLGAPPVTPSRDSVRWIYERYMHQTKAVTDEFVEQSWGIIGRDTYQAALADIRDNDLLAGLFLPELRKDKLETLTWLAQGRLQRPTQVVWGRNDRTAVLSRGLALFGEVSRWERRTRLAVVDKCGHFPYREHPQWFVDVLSAHLEEVETHDF